jgi:hypothetical protein
VRLLGAPNTLRRTLLRFRRWRAALARRTLKLSRRTLKRAGRRLKRVVVPVAHRRRNLLNARTSEPFDDTPQESSLNRWSWRCAGRIHVGSHNSVVRTGQSVPERRPHLRSYPPRLSRFTFRSLAWIVHALDIFLTVTLRRVLGRLRFRRPTSFTRTTSTPFSSLTFSRAATASLLFTMPRSSTPASTPYPLGTAG